jgi:hypothetical protein
VTAPPRFHLELDRLLAALPGEGAPSGATTEDASGCPCVALTYEPSAYGERVSADVAALQVVAGHALRASDVPYSTDPRAITLRLFFAHPTTPAAADPKPRRKSR